MRAETKAAIVVLLVALLSAFAWFLPWLLPGRALLGTHPALFRPFERTVTPEELAEIEAAARPLYGDKLLQHDPEVRFNGSEGAFALPAWNPLVLGGMPHVATGLSSPFHPLMWIARAIDPPRCYAVIAAVQTALAGWFAWLMFRAFGTSVAAAACGALLFAGSGWMSVHQEYFQLTAAATWLPLAISGAKRRIDECGVAERRLGRRGGAFSLGVAIGGAFLSGFPQIAVYSLLAPALLYVVHVRTAFVAQAFRLGVPAALGLLLAAPQLLATAELVPHSTRQALSADVVAAQALPPLALAGALLPDFAAPPRTQKESEERPASLFELALVDEPNASRANRFEVHFSIGAGAVLLALLAFAGLGKGARGFFVLLLIVGLVLTLPGPLLRASAHVPGLDIGDPKRALLLIELALAGLATIAIDRALADAGARRRALLLVGAGAVALAAASAICSTSDGAWLRAWAAPRIAGHLGLPAAEIERSLAPAFVDESRRELARELLLAAAACALVTGALGWRHARAASRIASGALFVALALPLARDWYRSCTPIPTIGLEAVSNQAAQPPLDERPSRLPPLLEHLSRHPPRGRLVRVGSHDEFPPWPPKLPMLAGFRDVQGYVAVYLSRWRDLLEAVDPGSTEAVGARPLASASLLEKPLFDLLDVEVAIAALPIGAEPPSIAGFDLEPYEPAEAAIPPAADYRIALWRNREALGRARVVSTIRLAESDEEVVRNLVDDGLRPADEAWMTVADAAPVRARPDWSATERTLTFQRAPDAAAVPSSSIELVSESAEDLRFRVRGPGGLLVQSDCGYPGWSVRVDGKPADLLRVDHALRGVVVAPGEHDVHFRYMPRGMLLGLFVVPFALAGLAFLSRGWSKEGEPWPPPSPATQEGS